MQGTTKYSIIAAIAIVAGPFLTFHGIEEGKRLEELDKAGVTVPGEIVGGESQTGGKRRSSSYKFDVAFTPKDGQVTTQTFKVKSDFFKSHVSGDSISDPAVQVKYIPAKLEEAVIVGGSTDDKHFFELGIGVAIAGLITLIICLVLKKRATAAA